MERKIAKTGVIIALLLMSMAFMANVPRMNTNQAVYVRADDSVDPSLTPIQCDRDVGVVGFDVKERDVAGVSVFSTSSQEWNKTYGGWGNDVAWDVKQTSDGGYILAGWTDSFGAGAADMWLVKTDSYGNMQWNKTYGGWSNEMASSVQQTNDGGYILAGYTLSFGAGAEDFWLVKTDANGNMQWNKTYGQLRPDEAYSVQQTSDGGYIVAGYATWLPSGAGYEDFWLVKTDPSGNHQWNKTYGGWGNDVAWDVKQTSDGGYILAGWTNSFSVSGYAFLMVKTDSSGNMQWNKTYDYGLYIESAYSVQQTSDGGYILAGYTDSFAPPYKDVWVVKTDSIGNMRWNKIYGGRYDDRADSVQQTSDGGFIVAGYTDSFGAGRTDFWLVKTDASGNMRGNQTYGGAGTEWAISVRQTSDGGFIVAGYTDSFGAGGMDFWLVKVPATVMKVTAPGAITINPQLFKFDETTKTLRASLGNMFLELIKGIENYVSVQASVGEGVQVYIGEPGTITKWYYLPPTVKVAVPLWLDIEPGIYSGIYEFEITVCNTYKLKLTVGIVHIWVCENAAFTVQGGNVTFTTLISGGSWAYLIADITLLPPSWSYSVDPANGTLFETPRTITLNITAALDAKEGDIGIVTLSAFSNKTNTMFWQFTYFAALDSTPPTIEAIQPLIHTPEGNLIFNTTVKDLTTGIESTRLFYSINYGPWNNQTMYWQEGDTFNSTTYILPLLVPDDSTLRYYIAATDWLKNQAESNIQTITIKYDIAPTSVTTTKTIVGQGYGTKMYATIKNQGTVTETLFNITLYADKNITIIGDEILIGKQTISSLVPGANTTITFTWNTTGFAKGNYTISAYAWPVPGETYTADNKFTDDVVTVTIGGDLDGNFAVQLVDLVILAKAYGSRPGEPPWNPNADLDDNGIVGLTDLVALAKNYGQTDP